MKVSVVKIDAERPDSDIIGSAAKAIREGKLVAFPTETVYGLGANLLDKRAVARLYKVKNRPRTKPFTVHISNLKTIRKMDCQLTPQAKALIDRFWPGPLTIILKAKNGGKIGFRMPANKVALKLIEASRVPVVAPSANLSGDPAPKNAENVLRQLGGKIDVLLDSGRTDVGVESTVIDMTVEPPKILREGAISSKEIFKTIGHG